MGDATALLGGLVALLVPLSLATLRLAPATIMLPLFGGRALPTSARAPILAVLALGAAPQLLDARAPSVITAGLALAALRELWLGLLLALVLATPFFALEYAGRLIDQARGGSSSELQSADGQTRGTPLSELLRWSWGAAFVASGGLRAVILAVSASFARWPVEPSIHELPALRVPLDTAVRWTAESLSAGLSLGAAGLLALVAAEATVAVASRVAPALAQSGIAVPARTLAALGALALALHALSDAGLALARRAFEAASAGGL
jgi:type III secretory pathway component EscT